MIKKLILLFVRKMRSSYKHCSRFISTMRVYSLGFLNPAICIGRGCTFEKGIKLSATDGGEIYLSNRVHLAEDVTIVASGGNVKISEDTFIGRGTVIVADKKIEIGRDTMISEYVVIRDQDHNTNFRPIRQSGLLSTPVLIGVDVWIGSKASVLRGSTIGDRATIGAHALVKSCIPSDCTAVGVPARVTRRSDGHA